MLNGLLIFMLIYFVAEVFVDYFGFGIMFEQVLVTLIGDEENFIEPISQPTFLEYIHTKIFFMMMILLTLSAVFIRLATKYRLLWLNTLMLSALFMLISLGLCYFFGTIFIYPYILLYFTWHLSAIYMTLYSIWMLNFAKSI